MRTHMKIAILTGLALATAACDRGKPGPGGLERGETLLQVSATGQNETKPDEARFGAAVVTFAATAESASQLNATKMTTVITAIRALGIDEKDIQTSNVSVSKVEWGPNRGKYQASNSVTVRVRDVTKAGPAIAAATGAGANNISGPDLRVSDPEKASRSAYASAFKAARARADTYAEAAGLKVLRVLRIRDGGIPEAPVTVGMYDMPAVAAIEQAAPPPVMAGTSESTAQVSVDFALGPK
jgi:uncharacterized protein YggE